MPDNFSPTVDLRDKMQPPKPPLSTANAGQAGGQAHPNPPFQKGRENSLQPNSSQKDGLESLPFKKGEDRRGLREGEKRLPKELEVEDKQEFQKINRPAGRPSGRRDWKALFIILAVLLVAGSYYWFVYRPRAAAPKEQPAKWYMVKLSDGETFYGQISNTAADPVVINNVYYDYDQVSSSAKAPASPAGGTEDKQKNPENLGGQIRLVKRGKETHGPDGTLNVVRSQVLYMESLAADSKVLKAIEEYEKEK